MPLQTPQPPPAVDPSKLADGEWIGTLSPQPGCPYLPFQTGYGRIATLVVGDCWQTLDPTGKIRTLHAHPAEFVDKRMLFRADDIVYNGETDDVHAEGHVYYYDFAHNEKIWCNKLDYHTEKGHEHGTFYQVIGETQARISTKPGFLTTTTPFHFEGEWAERDETKYIVHNGWITDCTMPKPWWRLRGAKFDIIPRDRAKAYDSTFVLGGVPIFFFPYFYHPMKHEMRHSGFLMPSPGHNSLRGFYVGAGYFWAINRSYDLTYEAQIFTSGQQSNHAEFRAKPKVGTDLDLVLFGSPTKQQATSTQPFIPNGLTAYGIGKSNLGDGWTAAGVFNYTTTLLFRQDWSQSYNEAVGSEISSSGYLDKSWSTFTFDIEAQRNEVFANVEQEITDPVSKKVSLAPADAVTIRKLPEAILTGRDHDLIHGLPVWYSFDASEGLMFRSQPYFDTNNEVSFKFQTSAFTDRLHFAPHLTAAFHLGPISFVPSIGVDETYYSEAQAPYVLPVSTTQPAPPSTSHNLVFRPVGTDLVRSARDFSLDLVLPSLERVYAKKTFLGDKLKHVIEPRASYRYVTGVGSDFDRFIRFDDVDILANTSEVDLMLANRLLAKRQDQVVEIFSWEIEQKRYFNQTFSGALVPGQRNVFAATEDLTGFAFLLGPRSYSPVVSRIRATPLPGLSFQWQTEYDTRTHAIIDSLFSADYTWKRYYHVSAGNNEVHTNPILTPYANQFRARISIGDANHRGWNAGLDSVYDYRQQKLLWATAQLTYNTDCCGLSAQFRRVYRVGLPDENLWAVSFSVANIGPFGTLKKQDRLF